MRRCIGPESRSADASRAAAALDAGAQAAQAGNRRRDIFTLGQSADPTLALCQGGQHQRPMRDRFITGDAQLTGNMLRRLDDLGQFHLSARHALLRQTVPLPWYR